MSLISGFRVYVCRSSTAAVELATKDPKNLPLAAKLLEAKNTSNNRTLEKAQAEFDRFKLTPGELIDVKRIAREGSGSSAGAVKAAADLLDRFQDHAQCELRVKQLQQKQGKYASLADKLVKAGAAEAAAGAGARLDSLIKDSAFWENARPKKTVTWADQQTNKAIELVSPGNWKH
jgi:hypothetical protein